VCKQTKQGHAAVVADAAQFYEQVKVKRATTDVHWVLEYVRRTERRSAIVVRTGTRTRGFLARAKLGYHPQTIGGHLFTFAELLTLFTLVISLTIVQFCKSLFYIPTVPIGNPFGRIAVEAVAGRREFYAMKGPLGVSLAAKGFIRSLETFADDLFCIRYVDDVLIVSRRVCAKCLPSILPRIYDFEFGVAGSTLEDAHVDWCDIRIRTAGPLHGLLEPIFKNVAYATGTSSRPKKDTIPPHWAGYSRATTLGILKGRYLRAMQISDDPSMLTSHVWNSLSEFWRKGYPRRDLKRAAAQVPHFPCRLILFKLLNQAFRTRRGI